MLFAHWFRRKRKVAKASAHRPSVYRPRIQMLEDRTLLNGSHWGGLGVGDFVRGLQNSGPATHLQVTVPEKVQPGHSFDVVVEAEDASNHPAADFTGTVQLSLQPADGGASVPASYTFTAGQPIHVFHVTLSSSGVEVVTATDTSMSSITGSATTNAAAPHTATQFMVIAPENVVAGTPTKVTVVALDASGHVVRNFTGTVSLSSTDTSGSAVPNSTTPETYTFTGKEHGRHTFEVTFQTTGPQTLTATSTSGSTTITGSASTTVDSATQVTHFAAFPLGRAVVGSPTQVEVKALNAANQVVTGYTGTITLTSSTDPTATITETSSSDGVALFSVTFDKSGKQTLNVSDNSMPPITASTDVWVASQDQDHSGGRGRGHWGWW